ncbi:YciI family protein [Piscinibacter sp.]|uniref:YciI family protein n=1 Tax=Piscinibacter sp. TaxID=1903157 RepID=UPI002C2A0521|nr:YciI family protein [Albitalea sp.]HUG21049.1 YciI family protein [Albitalea sp.]
MPTFITIGYGDREGYDRTPEPLRQAAHAHDAHLVAEGVVMGIAGECVQVRNPADAGVVQHRGPFMRSDLPIAGFSVLEAASLEEAIRMASKCPCAIAHGVIEVWPLLRSNETAGTT